MPYALSLQQYTPPEFYREPPVEWDRRLREVSADLPNIDHLVFRWFDSKNPDGSDRNWEHPERGQWTLYAAKPIRLVEKERAAQFEKHWSELQTSEQVGRRAVVSDYQHFMWHSRGLYVKPFLILQGSWGGTPAVYTDKEREILRAMDAYTDPAPIGFFPACPFDERTVTMILGRDRLLQVSGSYEDLEKLDSPLAMKHRSEEAIRAGREQYLKTFRELNAPCSEFFASYVRTKEAAHVLPRAPEGLGDRIAKWREHFIEHGNVIGAGPAPSKKLHITVQ